MYVFGEIDKSSTVIESNIVNYAQSLSSSVDGVSTIKIVSGSQNTNYWNSLNVLFYTSGSPTYNNELKFKKPSSNLSINQKFGSQFLNKYHGYPSSSLITIASQYYGEKIKPNSFRFTDVSTSNVDNDGNNPQIRDDGFGNLYSTNAHHSQSNASSSSIDNYVGNIFYDKGLAIITETGSWSGSVNYPDLGTDYNLIFESHNTITTYEYNVTLLPNEFNNTMNYSVRNVLTTDTNPLTLGTSTLASTFTSSDFQPYITTINLYQDGDYDTPVIQAKLPKPIKKSDKIDTRFKIKLDM